MLRSDSRILTTHVGSLPRPRELLRILAHFLSERLHELVHGGA